MQEISVNPLHGIVAPKSKRVSRPIWMCKHREAILVDRQKWIYRCYECNPTLGSITVIPRVSTKVIQVKKVTVSPSPNSNSPKGFSFPSSDSGLPVLPLVPTPESGES